jgi:hypothetical protein
MVAITSSVAVHEPIYQGEPASYWLDQVDSTAGREKSIAIRKIDPNLVARLGLPGILAIP